MSVAATSSRSGKSSSNGFTQLANGEHLEWIVKPEEGLISRRIFADPEIYQMEIDRIFGRGWFFLGHEFEIPNPAIWSAGPAASIRRSSFATMRASYAPS